ncbi:MAG: hypothetical protein M1822_009493 [Bathelium mastoideum]|nr:MAG: hypothetical protein M1822_009493 [Bathelium mastoideum]
MELGTPATATTDSIDNGGDTFGSSTDSGSFGSPTTDGGFSSGTGNSAGAGTGSSHGITTGAIIGIIIGAVIVLAIVGVLIWLIRRWRKEREREKRKPNRMNGPSEYAATDYEYTMNRWRHENAG